MAADQITPMDEIGMPLPIVPSDRILSIEREPVESDWHHHFHPRKSPVLTSSLGGNAVRHARLQLSDWREHHLGYHGNYEGPSLPDAPAQQFGIVVLACAGYVPNEAIDFSREEPRIVGLREHQKERLWSNKELKIGAPETIRNFLMEYTLGQDISDAGELIIDEFLTTNNPTRRYELGGRLLNLAIEKAAEPIDPFYRAAWRRGNIDKRSSMRLPRFLKRKISNKNQGDYLIEELRARLAA